MNKLLHGDCVELLKAINNSTIDCCISDIPYGICLDEWDILHSNTNKALMGASPSQLSTGKIFKKRGKPLNGWSSSDKNISLEYQQWCDTWTHELFRVLKPSSNVFIFAGRRLSHRMVVSMENAGFILKDSISWIKNKAPHRAQRVSVVFDKRHDYINSKKWYGWKIGNLRPIYEPIYWFVKPYNIGGTITDNILNYNIGGYNENIFKSINGNSDNVINSIKNSDNKYHPTQKPVELIELLIKLVTIENQIVLDPFAGSGTTAVACLNTNRKYICMEKDDKYFEIMKERVEEHEK